MKITLLFIVLILFITSAFGQSTSALQDKYILVMDIQDVFIKDKVPITTAARLIEEVNDVIEKSDPEKVIYIQSVIRVLSITKKGFSIDTVPDTGFNPSLSIVNNTTFIKSKPNAFHNEDLNDFLKEKGAKELVLVGLLAEHCITKTALAGLKQDYKMYLISSAIIGATPQSKDKALNKLIKKGVLELK